MKGIVDIHNHILFGLDDGAKTLRDSMELIGESYRQGVRAMIFTPHYYPGVYDNDTELGIAKYNKIVSVAREKFPDMEFYLGNEVLCVGEVVDLLKSRQIFTMANSKYVLVEFMVQIEYERLEVIIKELLINGYIPIIAHCERYECLKKRIGRVIHLVESGAYMQVNAKSVYTFRHKGFIKRLIDEDCLHFIASDAHDMKNRNICFDKCKNYLMKKYSDEYVHWLLVENPRKVIENKYV